MSQQLLTKLYLKLSTASRGLCKVEAKTKAMELQLIENRLLLLDMLEEVEPLLEVSEDEWTHFMVYYVGWRLQNKQRNSSLIHALNQCVVQPGIAAALEALSRYKK